MKKACRFVIQGTVQGVFFRRFVAEHAKNLSLTGFTRNLENGGVEVVVEGEQGSIERLKSLLEKGPAHAQIRSVTTEQRKWSGDFKEFKILRF